MYNVLLRNVFVYPSILISLTIYIYFLKVKFPPFYLILPYLLLGLFVFISEVLAVGVSKKYLYYFLFVFVSFLWALLSYVYNYNSDFFYIKETLLVSLIYFFSAFSIKKLFVLSGLSFDFENILKFSTIAIFFQFLISLLANIYPQLMVVFISFLDVDGLSLNAVSSFLEARFVGLGASFFGSGIITSFFLILLSFFIKKYTNNRNFLLYILIYAFFAIVGLLFSRTTIVGVIFSLLFFMNLKNFLKCVVIIIPASLMLFFIFKDLIISNEKVLFGLDFLFNFKKSQASTSVGALTEMYNILPDTYDTWLLGDSKYKILLNGDFVGYYKDTDVGYLRIIFANGIVGLLLFIVLNVYILFNSFSNRFLFLLLALCFFSLNFKGVAHIFFFSFLFFVANNSTKNQISWNGRS